MDEPAYNNPLTNTTLADTANSLFSIEEIMDTNGIAIDQGTYAIDTVMSDVSLLDPTIILDIKYATTDNFVHKKLYPCPKCYLRTWAADSLVSANQKLRTLGYRLVMYDCYRPNYVQKQMWQIVHNPTYVANPEEGSMHNRALAVDLSLVDSMGRMVNMGTEYDYFGPEARPSYQNLPEDVLYHRNLLRQVMMEAGFNPIRSEWWHFSMEYEKNHPVLNYRWGCE